MKIGILITGHPPEEMREGGDYDRYFARLLDGNGFDVVGWAVVDGEFPPGVDAADGWLITGSKYGVYENLDWMLQLQDFVRELAAAEVPLIGVCFGHQIIAQALGGEVVKSDRGWGVGLHRYRVDASPPWMQQAPQAVGIYAFHQDQVVQKPPTAEVFLSSEFCPLAGLTYGSSIISVQAHPEFGEDYERALLDAFAGNLIPADVAEAAYASMNDGQRADTQTLADWFVEFFRSRLAVDAASSA